MNNQITIYSNYGNKDFFESIFPNFKLKFEKLDHINLKNCSTENNILFFCPKDLDIGFINKFKRFKNILFILNKKTNLTENHNNSILEYPITISRLKCKVSKFFSDQKKFFFDIEISDQRIININNKKFCFFTHVEKDIFQELINQKKVKRKYLEENILKINFKVETRSLDSHLSRIRKKLKMIHSKIKIISRSENVILSD